MRTKIHRHGVKTVVIDGLNGYQAAMPEEQFLTLHIHELLQYLNRQGVSTFLTVAQHGLVGDMKSPVDVTYLADTVILLRYFEAFGQVRRAISIIKKRFGSHENTIREMRITSKGIALGEPLEGFQGILRGTPVFTDGDRDAAAQRSRRMNDILHSHSERAIILAPHGRDAAIAADILHERRDRVRGLPRHAGACAEIDAGCGLCDCHRRGFPHGGPEGSLALAVGSAPVVGFRLRAPHPSRRGHRAQSGLGASLRGSRQRRFPGASFPSRHAGERCPVGLARAAAGNMRPAQGSKTCIKAKSA